MLRESCSGLIFNIRKVLQLLSYKVAVLVKVKSISLCKELLLIYTLHVHIEIDYAGCMRIDITKQFNIKPNLQICNLYNDTGTLTAYTNISDFLNGLQRYE